MLVADAFAGLVLFVALLGAYFIPTFVAWNRGVTNKGSVLVINLFLGWTLLGWVIALAMAARTVQKPAAG